jgi:2-C-methyl-D-erythritol 4-phosphate cytidylyltransferase
MGDDKLWLDVGGRPLIAWTLEAAAKSGCFDAVVIAAPRGRWEAIRKLAAGCGLPATQTIEGGARRQESVAAALRICEGAAWVSVHDAARPLAPPELFRSVLGAAQHHGAATCGVPCVDTVKQVGDGLVTATLERTALIATQTPQAFAADLLVRAHANAREHRISADDDAYLVERLGAPVAVVPGDPRNVKVTQPPDLILVRALVAATA